MRVLLVPNTSYGAAVTAACDLATWLSTHGFAPVLVEEDARGCELDGFSIPVTEIGEPTLTVALGGDGTLLRAVHLLGEVEVPILGVNMGRLGFLSGAGPEGLRDAVQTALAGDGRIERRKTLEAEVVMEGRSVGRYRALNEVSVGRGVSGRVVEVALAVNGVSLATFACDGVVVATATGSTAYGLSAGGPIVSPDLGVSVIVPVSPHTLQHRPIVVGPSDVIEVRLPNPARREACVMVDGDAMPCRQAVESLTVRTCEHDVLLVKLDGRDFFEVVRDEFFGG